MAAHADRYVEARVPTHCSKDLDVVQKGYFNSGVILFNWPQVLKSSFLARTRKLSAARPDLDLWDQDPLNIVADGNWLRMDGRYNATRYVTAAGEWPVILHFTSSEKPWLPNYYLRQLKFRRAYRRFLAGTRWADYVKPKSAMGWLIVLWEPVMWWQQRRVGLDWQKKQSSRR